MPKPRSEKYKLQVQMRLSPETGKFLERIADEREMSLTELVHDLILLGVQSLKHRPLERASTLKAIDSSHEGRYGT